MLITEILARNARMYPHQTALVERDPAAGKRTEITWRQFYQRANRLSQALLAKGIGKGDRVVQLMTNCLDWLPIYFGILATGAWAVPLNFRFTAGTIERCVATSQAKVLVFGPEFIQAVETVKERLDRHVGHYIFAGPEKLCPQYAETYTGLLRSQAPAAPRVELDLADEAALYFTSGTTGSPKAVLLTHRNLEAACYVENNHHRIVHSDNFLCIPPLYHTGAKMHWFGNLLVGAKAVILKGTEPRWIMEAVSEEKVTIVWLLVPWALDILLAIESGELLLDAYNLEQWRLMHIGAQPVPPSLIRQWLKVFPNHSYDTNYGLTEATGPGCIHLGMENLHKVGAIGRPGFDWEYKIVDENLEPVSKGKPGELAVKGPGVMKEYYGNRQETAKTIVDGWLMTGDIAREDQDGFIWLVDRKKDIIITGGENIFPVEIEDFLQAHPAIQDVAVIGLPSLRLGEIAAAIVQPKPGKKLTRQEIIDYCKELPRYKRPRKVIFDQVPRNPTGKIEKPLLRKKYAGRPESFGS